MPYTWGFKRAFAAQFANFPTDQQTKVLAFVATFQTFGLTDFTNYPGKITPSWKGVSMAHPNYSYARQNHLWHYHIGIPHYSQVHARYKTSDWVLHFQWVNQGAHIDIVDIYSHYLSDGTFYLPPSSTLI